MSFQMWNWSTFKFCDFDNSKIVNPNEKNWILNLKRELNKVNFKKIIYREKLNLKMRNGKYL